MTSFRISWKSALCAFALVFVAVAASAADDGDRPQDVGVVHASGDEAWIDVPASLGDTWKATLAELKERGHLADADRSYLETNGQIALDTLWIAVLPGASLGAPISRVRIVVLVGADDQDARTAALVGAGAILGAIAERLPAQPSGPSPFPATEPEYAEGEAAVEVPVDGYATYNTYNTYNTYTTYDGTPYPYYDTYYYPSVVYVWKPWWWSGWCHNGWWLGWSSSCWSFGWGWGWGWGGCGWGGWGWNGFCNPWWAGSFCWSDCDPWGWDCDDDWDWDNGSKFNNPTLARQRLASATTPSLSFARDSATRSADSPVARSPEGPTGARTPTSDRGGDRATPGAAPRGVASFQDRTTTVLRGGELGPAQSTVRWRPSRNQPSGGLSSVDAFPPRATPAGDRGGPSSTSRSSSSSSSSGRSIVVSTRSSSAGTRAKPGSVTKLKGLSLSSGLGAIHDANSVGRSSGSSMGNGSSRSTSSSSSGKPASTFTIGANSGRSSQPTTISSAPSSAPNPGPSSHSSQTISSGPSHSSRPSSAGPSPSRSSAPAPSSSGSSLGSSRSSSGGGPSIGPSSSGGGRSSGGSSGGSSMGGGRSGGSGGGSLGGSGGGSRGSSGGGRGPR